MNNTQENTVMQRLENLENDSEASKGDIVEEIKGYKKMTIQLLKTFKDDQEEITESEKLSTKI